MQIRTVIIFFFINYFPRSFVIHANIYCITVNFFHTFLYAFVLHNRTASLESTNQKQLQILENSTPTRQHLSQKIQDDELPML